MRNRVIRHFDWVGKRRLKEIVLPDNFLYQSNYEHAFVVVDDALLTAVKDYDMDEAVKNGFEQPEKESHVRRLLPVYSNSQGYNQWQRLWASAANVCFELFEPKDLFTRPPGNAGPVCLGKTVNFPPLEIDGSIGAFAVEVEQSTIGVDANFSGNDKYGNRILPNELGERMLIFPRFKFSTVPNNSGEDIYEWTGIDLSQVGLDDYPNLFKTKVYFPIQEIEGFRLYTADKTRIGDREIAGFRHFADGIRTAEAFLGEGLVDNIFLSRAYEGSGVAASVHVANPDTVFVDAQNVAAGSQGFLKMIGFHEAVHSWDHRHMISSHPSFEKIYNTLLELPETNRQAFLGRLLKASAWPENGEVDGAFSSKEELFVLISSVLYNDEMFEYFEIWHPEQKDFFYNALRAMAESVRERADPNKTGWLADAIRNIE